MENVRRDVAELFGEAGYISVEIVDRIIYSQNHSVRSNAGEKDSEKPQNEGYVSLAFLDKKPQKYRCEHLSPALDCFAGGFGRISCFDNDFHETCHFKARHKRMVAENDRIRENMKKFEGA